MRKEKLEELKYYIEELKTIKLVNTSGTFLKSEAYDCILNNGITIKREKLIKGNNDGSAVIIMPVTYNNEILTVVEPRVFTKETVGIGFPAGYIEEGEKTWESAKRELLEETIFINLLKQRTQLKEEILAQEQKEESPVSLMRKYQ